MSRCLRHTVLLVAALSPLFSAAAQAGDIQHWGRSPTYGQVYNGVPADAGSYDGYNYALAYPPINASLYPCPKPNIPAEVGRTMITNPALAPHEMLYPHCYRALYPPYYYCNKGGLTSCLPFLPKPCLKGTEVCVKYKSCHGLFGYKPALRRICHSNSSWDWHSSDNSWHR